MRRGACERRLGTATVIFRSRERVVSFMACYIAVRRHLKKEMKMKQNTYCPSALLKGKSERKETPFGHGRTYELE